MTKQVFRKESTWMTSYLLKTSALRTQPMMLPKWGTLLTYGKALVTRMFFLSSCGKLSTNSQKGFNIHLTVLWETHTGQSQNTFVACGWLHLDFCPSDYRIFYLALHSEWEMTVWVTHMGCCLSWGKGQSCNSLLHVIAAASISSSETARSVSSAWTDKEIKTKRSVICMVEAYTQSNWRSGNALKLIFLSMIYLIHQ